MSKVLVRRFLHSFKENNFDLIDQFGHESLAYVAYEVEVLVEIDTKTGKHKIVGCEGYFLDEQDYQNEEITEVKEQ